jgi:hypothetical protein
MTKSIANKVQLQTSPQGQTSFCQPVPNDVPATIDELFCCMNDFVHIGRVVECVVVSIPVRMTAYEVIVEASTREPNCFLAACSYSCSLHPPVAGSDDVLSHRRSRSDILHF